MNQYYLQSGSHEAEVSDSFINPQAIYQTLIRQTPNLNPLSKFKTSKGSNKQLFPDAVKYPDFFNYNLVSPGRVIKKLQGTQSVLRGFYYQLMKLAFQIQIEDKDYIEVLKNVLFSPQFMLQENPSSPSSGKNYSDLQYKKIVAEFMEILFNQSIPNFQLSILSYPIFDQAIIKILQNLLKFKCSIDIYSCPSIQILKQLSQFFQVTMDQYGNCFKFEQSDIFLYEHNKKQFYIAFLNQMAQMSDVSESSRPKLSNKELSSSKKRIQVYEQEDDEYGFQDKNDRKNHRQHMHSQFEIQTPTKQGQQQRHCSSNLTESRNNSDTKIDKNYRYTYGFNEVKPQRQSSLSSIKSSQLSQNRISDQQQVKIPSQQQNKANTIRNQIKFSHNRESRQSLINELHKLVHQSTQSRNSESKLNDPIPSQYQHNYHREIKIPDSKLVSSITNPTTIINQLQMMKPQFIKSIEDQSLFKKQAPTYQYQMKGYAKKVTFEDSKFMIQSAQSDEVIGYSDFNTGNKAIHNYEKAPISNKMQSTNKTQLTNKTLESTYENSIKRSNFSSNQNLICLNRQVPHMTHTAQGVKSYNEVKYQQKKTTMMKHQQIHTANSTHNSDMFYSPKPILSKPTYLPPPSSKPSYGKEQTFGTLYRQFTDTKILDILPQEMQYNIRRMKRKYKGLHAKDYFGIKLH